MKMKINQAKIYLASALILLCGTLRAQEIKGVVVDSDEQPLFGASVYWAGTTVGTSTGLSGEFTLHRVKGRDRLVARSSAARTTRSAWSLARAVSSYGSNPTALPWRTS